MKHKKQGNSGSRSYTHSTTWNGWNHPARSTKYWLSNACVTQYQAILLAHPPVGFEKLMANNSATLLSSDIDASPWLSGNKRWNQVGAAAVTLAETTESGLINPTQALTWKKESLPSNTQTVTMLLTSRHVHSMIYRERASHHWEKGH